METVALFMFGIFLGGLITRYSVLSQKDDFRVFAGFSQTAAYWDSIMLPVYSLPPPRLVNLPYPGNQTLPEDNFLQQVQSVVENHFEDENFSIDTLSKELYMSRSQFYRKIKEKANTSPSVYVRNIRLEKAAHLLKNSDLNMTEIAFRVGFKDSAYFSNCFNKKYGKSPKQFKNLIP